MLLGTDCIFYSRKSADRSCCYRRLCLHLHIFARRKKQWCITATCTRSKEIIFFEKSAAYQLEQQAICYLYDYELSFFAESTTNCEFGDGLGGNAKQFFSIKNYIYYIFVTWESHFAAVLRLVAWTIIQLVYILHCLASSIPRCEAQKYTS